jgi:hypothetical protein
MRQITIQIKDSKLKFFLELVRNFDFVKIVEPELSEPSKEDIKTNIAQGFKEVKLIEKGKLTATPINEFLNEL